MNKYKSYLAVQVLNEGKIVTYRGLSRALKVHVTLAKQMLFDFHASQTAKNPKSLTATYLLCGAIAPASTTTQRDAEMIDVDNDTTMMESSPPPSSWMENSATQGATQVDDLGEDFEPADADVPLTHVVMVRQEELEEVKAEFEEIHWIHIYSLQPASPADMHVISTANNAITKSYLKSIDKDPMEPLKGLGAMINQHAIWRDVQNATAGPSKVVKPVATATTVTTKTIPTLTRESSSKSKSIPASKGKASIMSSFAKTPKAEPKPKKEDENTKNTPSFSDDDEDEDEVDEAALRSAEESVVKAAASREAKAARKEKLDALMDSDSDGDIEMSDVPAVASNKAPLKVKKETNPTSEDEEDENVEEVDESAALDSKATQEEPSVEEIASTVDGRRRGRRRVMKKRQFQDDDGYLVTKEEMQWESYSEDEPEPEREVKKRKQSIPPPTLKKNAKGGSNKQGSLMSFFGKK